LLNRFIQAVNKHEQIKYKLISSSGYYVQLTWKL